MARFDSSPQEWQYPAATALRTASNLRFTVVALISGFSASPEALDALIAQRKATIAKHAGQVADPSVKMLVDYAQWELDQFEQHKQAQAQ